MSCARSTIHDRVHKTNFRSDSGESPSHVTVDEIVIQCKVDYHRLDAAFDSD